MNFNFLDKYKDYSNVDLLKIVKRPNDYQTEAVEAATQILKKRQVLETESIETDAYYHDIDTTEQLKKDKLNSYKEKAGDFLEPILKPRTEVPPNKWVNILLLVIGLQYLWSFYNTVRHFISFLKCDNCHFDISILFEFLSLIYVPIIFFLLLKRKRWGWMLLFADNLFSVISQLSQSYIYFKYWDPDGNNIFSFFIPIIIKVAFAFFLWRREISNFFNVTQETKKKTALITIVITLLFVGILTALYGQ